MGWRLGSWRPLPFGARWPISHLNPCYHVGDGGDDDVDGDGDGNDDGADAADKDRWNEQWNGMPICSYRGVQGSIF